MTPRGVVAVVFLAATAAPATSRAVASAELYRNQPELYGRFEARIRYAAGDGVISSFFLWKVGSEVAGTYWNELDFEKLNADCRMQTNTLYGNPLIHAEQSHTMPSDMCAAYHDYLFEWTPNYIAWSIDAREIRRETGAAATAFAQNATAGMRIHFNVWPGNASFGGNFDPAILPVRQYISWVQYSSYQNGSFRFEWREDFDGTSVPSGWATADWASPLNLSTHNPQNVSFVNGIAVLSLTSDAATGFTGAPPVDSGSGGRPSASGGAGAGGANGGRGGAGNAAGGSLASGGATGVSGSTSTMPGGAGAGGSTNAGTGNAGTGNAGTGNAGTGNAGAGNAGAGNAGTGNAGTGNAGTGNAGAASQIGGAAVSNAGSTSAGGAGPAGASGSGADASAERAGCGCRDAGSKGSNLGAVGAAMLFGLACLRRRRVSTSLGCR